MTRVQVAAEYTLSPSGLVISPGKFEGDPWWVVALWDASLNGFADRTDYDGDTQINSFAIDDKIVAMLGYRPTSCDYVALWERSDGFVEHNFVTERSLDEIADDDGSAS